MGLFSFGKKSIVDTWKKESVQKLSMPSPAVGKVTGEITEENTNFLFNIEEVTAVDGRNLIVTGTVVTGYLCKDDCFYVISPDGNFTYTGAKAFGIGSDEVENIKAGDKCSIFLDPGTNVNAKAGGKIVLLFNEDILDVSI